MAGNVTEREILSLLKQTFRRAAEHCDNLAVLPARGPTYQKLRDDLATCENCCRQVAWYRQDTRWLHIGLLMEEAHKRSGNWLRTIPRTSTTNHAHPLFIRLAENMRAGIKKVEELETMATGRVGMILPEITKGPIRTQDRPMQVKTPGGLILPPGFGVAA